MHIIIPMSGIGKRFLEAGYTVPKPLIEIDGKLIIEHVCDLFPGENKITFICRDEHLTNTNMKQVLSRIRPQATIVGIAPHKLGPVYAVSQIFDLINDDEEIIVNYCDFGTYWNYHEFLHHTRTRNADGAIPAYRGFHPHMLGTTNYAFMRDEKQWMLEIQEKKPFTDNRLQEFASNGTYYFKYGKYVKKYFQELMDLKHDLNGEYYISMIYNLLRRDQLKISIYEIQHMLQWGTPEDVDEYLKWSDYFKTLANIPASSAIEPQSSVDINLIPLAGRGSRFQQEGYALPKPLIPVSGKPMIIQAAAALPIAKQYAFVCLQEHLDKYPLQSAIMAHYPHAKITALNAVTEGQAITCQLGFNNIDNTQSVLIAACDNSMLFDEKLFQSMVHDPTVDGIVFTFKHHLSVKRNPQMYGYVGTNQDGFIEQVSVKVPLSTQPTEDHAIVGAFYFKSRELFETGLNALKINHVKVNNEYYVDSLIGELVKSGYKFKHLLVDHYVCWGTPDDLRTFEYWQSFFHKVDWHPYSIYNDPFVALEKTDELANQFVKFKQEYAT